MQIIRGKIPGALKVVVYGPEGIGKSTFASKFPDPLFIDTEGSTKEMDVARFPAPTSWTMLLEQVKYVRDSPGICKTLIIDTADWAEQLCIDHVVTKANKDSIKGIEDFGYGKGYVYLAENFGKLLNLLSEVIETNTCVVLTAHAKMRKVEQPDELNSYDRWEMKLTKNSAPLVKEWADMVLFANYKTYVVVTDDKKAKAQGGKRVMYTSHHPCWDAKNRHQLPDELPFEYSSIAHVISGSTSKVITNVITPPPAEPEKEPEPPKQETIPEEPQKTEPVTKTMTSSNASKLPKALEDLMRENNVNELEIRWVVGKRGYYPADTPIENYDDKFISGVLIGAWPKVFAQILDMRENDLPFTFNDKEKKS